MEDLFDVQVKKMDMICMDAASIQSEDLVSQAIYGVQSAASEIMRAFHGQRFDGKVAKQDLVLQLVKQAMEWTTVLSYCLEMDPPELEDVEEFADHFESSIAADVILSALHVIRSLADLALGYFCNDEAPLSPEEMEDSIAEITACLELIARRLNTSLRQLILNA